MEIGKKRNVDGRERPGSFCLPEIPLLRYMADMTPTAKAMLTDRYWPLVSLLVFTCAAAEHPKSFTGDAGGQGHGGDVLRMRTIVISRQADLYEINLM